MTSILWLVGSGRVEILLGQNNIRTYSTVIKHLNRHHQHLKKAELLTLNL